jgi:hypothetical protein
MMEMRIAVNVVPVQMIEVPGRNVRNGVIVAVRVQPTSGSPMVVLRVIDVIRVDRRTVVKRSGVTLRAVSVAW